MNISAVLLAGGESRRMGRDKATMVFCGRPLWQNQLQLLRRLDCAEVFISARADPIWRPDDVRFVSDEPPSRGPLSGIAAALNRMRSTHLLTLAIDMPFMSAEHLRWLCEKIEAGRGVVPIVDDRVEPLAAIYPREAEVDVASALAGSDFSLRSLTDKLVAAGRVRAVAVTQKELYRNLNEPADLEIESATP